MITILNIIYINNSKVLSKTRFSVKVIILITFLRFMFIYYDRLVIFILFILSFSFIKLYIPLISNNDIIFHIR